MEQLKGQRQLRNRLENMSRGQQVLARLQTEVTTEAKRNTRPFHKTGNLGRTIRPGYLSDSVAFVRASANYAAFVEMGTGIYGPKKRPITPKRGKVLVWHDTRKGGALGATYRRTGAMNVASTRALGTNADIVVARSVKGRPATPFLAPAVKTVAKGAGLKDVYIGLWNEGA